MTKLDEPVPIPAGGRLLAFLCPACGCDHAVTVDRADHPCWTWNGSVDAPTFSPSLLVRWGHLPGDDRPKRVCHSFVENGSIRFLEDCTHSMAGQTVPIPDYPS